MQESPHWSQAIPLTHIDPYTDPYTECKNRHTLISSHITNSLINSRAFTHDFSSPGTLDQNVRSRSKGDEKFRAVINGELAKLHNVLDDEAEVREQEDDEVVETLSAYTKKLQQSLHIINSIET